MQHSLPRYHSCQRAYMYCSSSVSTIVLNTSIPGRALALLLSCVNLQTPGHHHNPQRAIKATPHPTTPPAHSSHAPSSPLNNTPPHLLTAHTITIINIHHTSLCTPAPPPFYAAGQTLRQVPTFVHGFNQAKACLHA